MNLRGKVAIVTGDNSGIGRQTSRLAKKVRVALDWTLDLIFSKDLVQLPTLRSSAMSETEHSSTATTHETEAAQ